jgi:hypothetical protein
LYADHPAFAAHRAAPDRFFGQFRLQAAVIFGRRRRNVRRREQFPAPRQACFAVAVGEYAEEPDALVAPWQDVYPEAPDKSGRASSPVVKIHSEFFRGAI